jgi:hypothetical protein
LKPEAAGRAGGRREAAGRPVNYRSARAPTSKARAALPQPGSCFSRCWGVLLRVNLPQLARPFVALAPQGEASPPGGGPQGPGSELGGTRDGVGSVMGGGAHTVGTLSFLKAPLLAALPAPRGARSQRPLPGPGSPPPPPGSSLGFANPGKEPSSKRLPDPFGFLDILPLVLTNIPRPV